MEKNSDCCSKVLHVPFDQPDAYHSLNMPVYDTVAFAFNTAEEMEAAFCGKSSGHAYSRITNPTVQYFEKRIRQLQKAMSVTALSSGMAAISCAIMTVAKAGTNIVTSRHLFGNTFSLLTETLAEFGVEIRLCDLTNLEETEKAVDENTCAIYLEIITNPQMEVADLQGLAAIGKQHHVPLIADTTVVPFTEFKAKDLGINIEVLSSTKYLGCGTSLGGLIIDYGTFNWKQSLKLAEAARRYGSFAFTAKLKNEIYRNIGSYMAPHPAYMQNLALETLPLRFQRQAETCLRLAERLLQEPRIQAVNYTGLKDNPFYELSLKQFGTYPGAMLTFDLSSREDCFYWLNHLKLITRATNLFENKTLAIHPASTIFGTFSKKQLREMNVKDTTIRLSVGLEDGEALMEDILQALPPDK